MEEISPGVRRWDGELRGLLLSPRGAVERKRSLTADFREHFGFLALLVVSGACIVYLMQVLSSILRPFLWALFLVMGLTPAVSVVERTLFCVLGLLLRCAAGILRCVCRFCRWVCPACFCRCCRQSQRRTIVTPSVSGAAKLPRRGGRREDSQNSVDRFRSGASSASETGCCDPGERDYLHGDSDDEREKAWGSCTRFIVHAVAIAVVVAGVVCAIGGLVLLVFQSVISLQGHWGVYKQGARNFAEGAQRLGSRITGSMPGQFKEEIGQNALEHAEALLQALVTEIFSDAWRVVLEFLMMALYIAFWLSDPMPIGYKMQELFKRYIILKGLACLGYGLCVGALLHSLSVDLAEVFGLAAFLLSFVPEVGAIVALLLPAPVILFDSRLESPPFTFLVATSAQMALKFVFANVVEVKLVEADQLMKMHPVIILLAVTFFGFIWGPTGMLLSMPLVAYIKVVLLSDQVPSCYRDPLLVILEGDRSAPAKYARKRLKRRDSRGQGSVPDQLAETIDEVRPRLGEHADMAGHDQQSDGAHGAGDGSGQARRRVGEHAVSAGPDQQSDSAQGSGNSPVKATARSPAPMPVAIGVPVAVGGATFVDFATGRSSAPVPATVGAATFSDFVGDAMDEVQSNPPLPDGTGTADAGMGELDSQDWTGALAGNQHFLHRVRSRDAAAHSRTMAPAALELV